MIDQAQALNELARICYEANKKWWLDLDKPCTTCKGTGHIQSHPHGVCVECGGWGYPFKDRNVGELLMLRELSEAFGSSSQ